MPPSLPEAIGKYTVERFIESGGMGDVYLARDPSLDRQVAIKFLREGFDSDEMRERFEREARAAGRLSHPNIVTIYEFGEFDRRPFIAMEFVRGEPLSKLIRRRESVPLVRKLEMMEGLCSGLGHAHKGGIVHRDVKPANLMVDVDGPLKILDFGIVRMAGSGLTSHGVLVGTINYMSPEQIAGSGTIDHRSDVFAVGAVLYEVFTYQRAFPGEMADVLYKIVHTRPESPATLSPGLDPGIVRAIEQCLDKAPERRYQDLNVLRRDLARIRQRLEVEESETFGHSALTHRQATDSPGSYPGRPVSQAPSSVPPGTPPPRAPAPGTSPSERARRADEAAERERIEEAQRVERAQFERELAEKERQRQEQARAEQARAEQARQEQARQAQAREEQARLEQARQEQARLEAARLEEARLAKARAEEAERARVERERAEQARLAEARKAREEADRMRADEQQRAREEAAQQAEARRLQKRRDLAEAKRLVDAGRFAEAVQLLKPWASESGTDATYNGVLLEAESGVAKLEAERREQEAIAHHVAAAAEMLVRQDLAGAGRAVQAILKAYPSHVGAQNLEREIVRAVEARGRAATTVERARSVFDAQPGEALEMLERFAPPHSLVDAALAELRARHTARERERQRQERRDRRQATLARVSSHATALVRHRGVQATAALLLVGVVAVASWRAFAPDSTADVANPPGAIRSPAGDRGRGDEPRIEVPSTSGTGSVGTPPSAPTSPSGTPVDASRPRDPRAGGSETPVDVTTPKRPDPTSTRPDPGGRTTPDPRSTRDGGGNVAAVPPAVAEVDRPSPPVNPGNERPAGAPATGGRVEPAPTAGEARSGEREATPAAPDPVQVAKTEIQQWMSAYQAAYRSLDARRVKAMNRAAQINTDLLNTASVQFSNVAIDVAPDGRSAALRATVRYDYSWKRSGPPPSSTTSVVWPFTKVGSGWVAN